MNKNSKAYSEGYRKGINAGASMFLGPWLVIAIFAVALDWFPLWWKAAAVLWLPVLWLVLQGWATWKEYRNV